ncbi:bacteriorhodopsin [Stratiformator vulcanicus]|uniref:Green-light absorbing proteorhodopsin n=1 Tax=Stratiformator vulcanicus TaxID=2527980 RepID=A0A517QXI7_9PLAN|nr:bacteriorhodopsin [Stratiformator vulcanicus]QDT36303.1 Green-light absorbing proteorhodopsin precursor [Stratiformator vulcanicus]
MTFLLAAVEGGLSMDFAQNTPLESLTLYLFFAGTVGMGAGAIYFFMQFFNVAPQYRSAMAVSTLICGIACFHYSKMTSQYMSGEAFPTALRYVDWLFTTPLLLVKFPLLLQIKKGAGKLMAQLIVLDVLMIVTAFIAETSAIGSGAWWGFFIVACVFELAIVAVLYTQIGKAIAKSPPPIADATRVMRYFILIGWAIYPVGFLMALGGAGEYREIFYNVADVINKVGFGLVALAGIQALTKEGPGGGVKTDVEDYPAAA